MDLNKLNPEINYKGRHFKISLVSLGAILFGISQVPAAMTMLGVSAAASAIIPEAVRSVAAIAAPILGSLAYTPTDTNTTPKT
jgi:hypothetical protein